MRRVRGLNADFRLIHLLMQIVEYTFCPEQASASLRNFLPAHGSDIGFDIEPRHHVLDRPVLPFD